MSKKDPQKDKSQVEEIDLNTLIGSDAIFDLGKIREKATLSKETPLASADVEVSNHDNEEHSDEIESLPLHEMEEIMDTEDDILPLKDEDLLLLEDDLIDFEDDDMDDEDEEESEDGEGTSRKKRER